MILSGRYEEREKVEALDRGADDYVTKPFGVDELRARIRVALRRAAGPGGDPEGRVTVGPLVLDAAAHEVRIDGRPVDLTPREFELLRVLLTHRGRVVTKGRLLRAVWGEAYQGEDSYVYVHVSQLRRKLAAADPAGGLAGLIRTEPGVGYRIRDVPDRAGRSPEGTDRGPDGDDGRGFRQTLGPRNRTATGPSWRPGRCWGHGNPAVPRPSSRAPGSARSRRRRGAPGARGDPDGGDHDARHACWSRGWPTARRAGAAPPVRPRERGPPPGAPTARGDRLDVVVDRIR